MDSAAIGDTAEGTEVEVLLHFEHAALYEVVSGRPQQLMSDAELAVVSFVPSPQQIQAAEQALQLPAGALSASSNASASSSSTPLVFILVGDFKIPINKQIIAIQSGAFDFTFVLPNRMFLQIVLPQDGTCDPEELDVFEHLIFSHSVLRKKPATTATPSGGSSTATSSSVVGAHSTAPAPKVSTRIAIGLGKITRGACLGITKGAELLSGGIRKGSEKIVDVTDACKEPVKVSESTKGHVNRARTATKGVAVLSGTVATAMVGVTAVLGNFIGNRVANRVASADENGGTVGKLAAVKEVGGAAIGCAGLIFDAAVDAGRTILSSSCDGISRVVTHKLGDEAGQLTANGLGVVTDVVDIQTNVRKAGVKGIVAATAQSSAVAMIDELDRRNQQHPAAAAAASPS